MPPSSASLLDLLPGGDADGWDHDDPDAVFEAFTGWTEAAGITLYPAQEEALIEIVTGSNVIVATPTGSGKSLVAAGAQFAALAQGRRSFYTAPIKALVSEKFFALIEMFGAANVGMVTGDAAVNADAPILCGTAEVLANAALRHGPATEVDLVVMDEFHYYADPQRGWAWQVPLVELPDAQFVLMSATLGDTTRFEADLRRRTGRETVTVSSAERPVPLSFEYVTSPIQETIEELLSTHQAPVYVVHFTQASALERAQALSSITVASRAERDAIVEAIGDFGFRTGFGKTLSRLVRMGIGVHHAGMLPRYRRLVETLTQAGLLKVVCGTDTLGVGINVPIRTVVFSGLTKYDGVRQRHLQVREFQQIAGRAGRAGYDTTGTVVVEAPDHVVENEKQLKKAGDDPRKKRKVTRKKAPEGFVNWTDSTFERLTTGVPEPLTSQMRMSHAIVLNVIARAGEAEPEPDAAPTAATNPYLAMAHLVRGCDEDRHGQRRLLREAIGIYRALLAGGVVERVEVPGSDLPTARLTVELQADFALNQPLSPFAVAALDVLDPDDPAYALDVVSVIEATLDDPRPVIGSQRYKARGEAVAEMKSEGLDYEDRMELLEDVEHPQPLREVLEVTYEAYRTGHPWVGDHPLRPKTVVREMYERAMTFSEYVSYHSAARSEGLVLRYLSDVYKALRHTVPEAARDETLDDLTAWLGELVRQTDSSLLDEWELLAAGGDDVDPELLRPGALDRAPAPVTANERAFRVLVRNALFQRVEHAALRRVDLLAELDAGTRWDAGAWGEALTAYFEEYDRLGTGPDARGPALVQVDTRPDLDLLDLPPGRWWSVRQVFDDPEGDRDWGISAVVDLDASDEAGTAVVRVTDVGPR